MLTGSQTHLYVPDLELGRALVSSRVDNVHYYGYAQAPRALALVAEDVARLTGTGAALGVGSEHTSTPARIIELPREHGVRPVAGGNLVERERLVLSTAEIRCAEEAAVVTQRGVDAAVRAASRPDATVRRWSAISETLLGEATAPSAWVRSWSPAPAAAFRTPAGRTTGSLTARRSWSSPGHITATALR